MGQLTSADVEANRKYSYITAGATTQVKTGYGRLHKIIINKATTGTIGIIDNTTGSTVNIGQIAALTAAGTMDYGLNFSTGLRIINSATEDITVVYS